MVRQLSGALCASLALFSIALVAGSVFYVGLAGADTEIGSGTQWNDTGWVEEPFYTCDDGTECPVWSWAYYIGGITWQAWSASGGGDYDKMTQDFWGGLLGSEAGSGAPSNHDDADIYVTGVGAAHYDGSSDISTAYGDGTCYEEADPPFDPCDESEANSNGHHFSDPIDYGYVEYASNYGYTAEYPNGAQSLTVLSGYIS